MRKFYLATFLIGLFIVCETAFFVFVVVTYSEKERNFRVTESGFNLAVRSAVTNYLTTVSSFIVSNPVKRASFPSARVEFVDELSIWLSPRRGYMCRIDGNDYCPGDIYGDGVIVSIRDSKVYVQLWDDSFVVLRRGSSAPVRVSPLAADTDGGGEPGERL